MSNTQLNIYYKKDAEKQVQFQYELEISKLKKQADIDKQRVIIETKHKINDEYMKEDKILTNKYQAELEIEYSNSEKEFENILEIFDKETNKLTINISDEEIIKSIKLENFDNNNEYQKKIRDVFRSHKGHLRQIQKERKTLRRNLIFDIKELKQEKKDEVKNEIDEKYFKITTQQEIVKNNSINTKMIKINRIWDEILIANINRFNNSWKQSVEEKIQTAITQLINKNKSRDINNFEQYNKSSILDLTETLNNRLLTDWAMEKKKLVTYKLRYNDSLIKALKVQISKKWKTKEEHIIQKYDMELENKLREIENSIETYNNNILVNHKKKIVNSAKLSAIELDRNDFQTESEYLKRLRDEERHKRQEFRKLQKELRKNKTIPDIIKKQLETFKKKCMKEKFSIKEKYQKIKSYDIQKLLKERDDDIIYEVKKLIENLTDKANREVDTLKASWISKKKEESLLLNKVQDNNILEIQLITLKEQLRNKNATINELRQITGQLLVEKKKFQTEIKKLNKYIAKYKEDKEFVDKLKIKYMKKENIIQKKQEKTEEETQQNVVNKVEEPKTSLRTISAKKKDTSKIISKIGETNKKRMEKKLLMKMTLREKGPLFEHNYICTGIYRKETDFEILFKAKDQVIIHLKYDSKSNFVNLITTDTNISLSCILEKDEYYEIIFTFNNGIIMVNINNIGLGSYEIKNGILENIIVRIKSTRSIFYHQYIKYMN